MTNDPLGTAIGIAGLSVMVAALVIALLRWERRRRSEEAARREVLRILGEHFDLRSVDAGLEGRFGARDVRVTFQTEHLLMARLSLTQPILPPGARVVEFADGPYQKQEELHIGGAHVTGDRDFDAKFLVYGTVEGVQAISAEVRALLLEHPLDGLAVTREEVSRPLSLVPTEAAAALEDALALCDALESLPTAA